jgi:hypothetical protein
MALHATQTVACEAAIRRRSGVWTLWRFWRLFRLSYLSIYCIRGRRSGCRSSFYCTCTYFRSTPEPDPSSSVRCAPCLNPERFLVLVSHHAEITSPSMPATRESMPPPRPKIYQILWEVGNSAASPAQPPSPSIFFNSRDDLSTPSSQRDFKEPIPLFSGVIVAFLVAHLGVSKA